MNKIHLYFIFILALTINKISFAYEAIYENTSKAGNIYSDERWKGNIVITGDVTINYPAIVTIEPGTIVKFSANSDDQHQGGDNPILDLPWFPNDPQTKPSEMSSIFVYGGALIAIGEINNKILFTSNSSNPKKGDWHSIQYGKEGSYLFLQNIIYEYAYHGIQINRFTSDDYILINNNTIRHIVTCGICSGPQYEPGNMNITISNNDISDCGHEAIDTHVGGFVIENNYLHDNLWSFGDGPAGQGLIIDQNTVTVRYNKFYNNRCGVGFISNNTNNSSLFGNIFIGNDNKCCGTCTASYDNDSNINQTILDKVTEIYVATFGRAPDIDGLMYWVGQVEAGSLTIDQVAQSFFDQPETKSKYSQGTSNATFINSIYMNTLNREADQIGLNYWVKDLENGVFTRSQAIMAIINGAKAPTGNKNDATMLDNKKKSGLYFASWQNGVQGSVKSEMMNYAIDIISNVNNSSQSLKDAMIITDNLAIRLGLTMGESIQ